MRINDLLTLTQASRLVKVPKGTLYRHVVYEKTLPCQRVGHFIFIDKNDLLHWFKTKYDKEMARRIKETRWRKRKRITGKQDK